ncbi:hypothetical protein VNO77_03572 [Canavalia gladiata]|uniref:Uncharacterized protein n=1 Tax=Canavalia gladiata TaxID=3824 RepID=A0AAN9R897_CANGL
MQGVSNIEQLTGLSGSHAELNSRHKTSDPVAPLEPLARLLVDRKSRWQTIISVEMEMKEAIKQAHKITKPGIRVPRSLRGVHIFQNIYMESSCLLACLTIRFRVQKHRLLQGLFYIPLLDLVYKISLNVTAFWGACNVQLYHWSLMQKMTTNKLSSSPKLYLETDFELCMGYGVYCPMISFISLMLFLTPQKCGTDLGVAVFFLNPLMRQLQQLDLVYGNLSMPFTPVIGPSSRQFSYNSSTPCNQYNRGDHMFHARHIFFTNACPRVWWLLGRSDGLKGGVPNLGYISNAANYKAWRKPLHVPSGHTFAFPALRQKDWKPEATSLVHAVVIDL